MQVSLNDQVAIVTGGFGKIGNEFVKAFKKYDARVVVLDSQPLPKRTVENMSLSTLPFTSAYQVDITDATELKRVLEDINKRIGVPTILVNCAGIDFPPDKITSSGLLDDKEREQIYDRVMEVNVKGIILLTQLVAENMIKHAKKGSIINISSIYGEVSPDQRIYDKGKKKPIAYIASKSALPNITRYLATYYASHGVRVNTLTMGGVFNNQPEPFFSNYVSKVPLGRMANPDDYNGAVIFLASDLSSYMTGANLIVDGGYTAW